MDLAAWFQELRRRRVIRALLGWGLVSFAVLQVIDPLLRALRLPEWSLQVVVAVLAVGFPVTAGLAWAFDLTRKGIERTGPAEGSTPATAARWAGARPAVALVLLGALVGAGVAWLALRQAGPSAPAPTPSIAVLPFADMSPGKDQEYFADSVAEEILNALAQVDGLRVPGRTSSFWFKGKTEKLVDIGRELKVTHVLEGSVRRAGKRLRVTAQVVNVADGGHLWSETFDRDESDVFAVQDEVARAVVQVLKVKLLPGAEPPASSYRTGNMEAYEQYLLGWQFLSRFTLDDVRRGISALEKAVALDPDLAPAWTALAWGYWWMWHQPSNPMDSAFERRALAAAERAVALAPRQAGGYAVRAVLRSEILWNIAGSDEDLARARTLAPNQARVNVVACIISRQRGRFPEAVAACRRTIELEPLVVGARNLLCWTYLATGELALARVVNAKVFEISPGSVAAQQIRCRLDFFEGRRDEARDHCGHLPDEGERALWHALMALEWGTAAEADQALADLVALVGLRDPMSVADAYAWRGDPDQAFAWLERAYEQRVGLSELKADPLLRKIRGDPRYATLLRRLKLPVD